MLCLAAIELSVLLYIQDKEVWRSRTGRSRGR